MAIVQNFDLNLIPESEPVIVHVNQYDTGIGRLVVSLYNGDTPYSPTGSAAIQGTKPDGKGFMYSATLSGNTVTADLKDQMSVVAGRVRCQIVVSETSGITGTFCFDLDVQASALPDDAEVSESDYPIIEELIHEAQTAAATAAAAEINAEDSAEDSEAWAVGTRGGEPVPSTDPTYHNNSKYWAEHGGGGTGGHVIMNEDGEDMPARNTLQFMNMEVTDDAVHGITVVTGESGLLPYLFIDSEAGSTVTVVAPDSSVITPTAAGSGHWECEVPGYGIYVIHSLLNGEDATINVTIDTVKEYHITDSHYDFTINVTAQVGATLRVECGTEVYTDTGTGSPIAFVVHQASASYTVEATLDGYTDTETVVSASTTGQSTSVTLHIFTATLNISTTDADLAGQTITITKGGSTVGTTALPASSPYSVNFTVHETGSYTASVTYSGDTYSDTHTVSSETTVNFEIVTIPDGSTVTPTDDIQIWLACAGITDKSYTTVSEVLADTATLVTLMATDNAVDYLVRSTTWASDITADEDGMNAIGSSDYCADTLLDNSTWRTAICGSTYFESVLNAKVPTMTSNTTPSGEASASSNASDSAAFRVFDGNSSTYWRASGTSGYLTYRFASAVQVNKVTYTTEIYSSSSPRIKDFTISASNDGTDFSNVLYTGTHPSGSATNNVVFENNNSYLYYRITISNTYGNDVYAGLKELQFYGRAPGGVQTWLKAGDITNKDYMTLAEVLADSTTLLALMSDIDAADYLSTCGLAWGSSICDDSTAMTDIGANNYCANKLLAESAWIDAISNSTYFESVLNTKVPTMTSNNAPSGEVSAKSEYSGNEAFKAFDNNDTTNWAASSTAAAQDGTQWVAYQWADNKMVKVYKVRVLRQSSDRAEGYRVEAYNPSTEQWEQVYTPTNRPLDNTFIIPLEDVVSANKYRIYVFQSTSGNSLLKTVQFWGRTDV